MEKFNKKLCIALIILSVLSIFTSHFDVMATLATFILVANVCLAILASLLAMKQIYHYNQSEYNPGVWWFSFGVTCGALIIGICYATGLGIIGNTAGTEIILGFSPTIISVIGFTLGNCYRILKGETSTI